MRTFCTKKAIPMLFMLSLLLFPAVSFAEYVGSFSRIEGRVDLLRAGATTVVPARRGDGVSTGDIIRTKSDGRAEILFKDDTLVTVASETRLKIDEYAFNPDNSRSKGMLSLLRGKIRAAVSKVKAGLIPVSLGSPTFSVNTPTSVAGVRGTVFFVFFDKGITGVIFKEGNGFVYNQNMPDKIVNVGAGQATFILTDDAPPLPPRQATEAEMSRHLIDTTIDGGQTTNDTTDTSVSLDQPGGGDVSGYNAPKTADTGVDPGPPPPVLPITETNTGTLKETVPPLITITSSPPAITNSSSGSFTITANEPVTFTYTMDSWGTTIPLTTSDTITLAGLPEGSHTLSITATDAAGNVSTSSYSWTTDYTPPASLALTGTPSSITKINTATIGATATDANGVTYSYTLDGAASTGALTGLTEGTHTFVATATDGAGNISTTTYSWTTDYTPPTSLALTGTPASITNINNATIGATATDATTITYSYTLDSVTSTGTLTSLTEGPHTFIVTATDAAGNVSTSSYSWTTDYTGPVATLTPAASPESGDLATINVSLSSNESSTYLYRLDAGSLTSTGPTFTLAGISEGSHTVDIQATDAVGNVSTTTLAFYLSRYSLSGNFWGCIGNVTGTVSGDVAGISGQNWGGWNMTMDGTGNPTPNETWTLYAGGTSSDVTYADGRNNGYWIEVAPGSSTADPLPAISGTLSGTSTFKYLSYDRLGIGTGSLTGTYDGSGVYLLTDAGNGTYTETPLAFSGNIGFDTIKPELYNDGDGIMGIGHTDGGLLGGTMPSLSNPTDVTYMGPYSATWAGPYMWTPVIYSGNASTTFAPSYDNNKFWGYIGGVWEEGAIDGKIYSLYIDQNGDAGILKGSLTGAYYPDILMYSASGPWSSIKIASLVPQTDLTDLTNTPNNTWNGINSSSGTITGTDLITAGGVDGRRDAIANQTWGIWQTMVAGMFDYPITAPFTDNQWDLATESYKYMMLAPYSVETITGTHTNGTLWSINTGETIGKLAGTTYGYGADISATPNTWISVGETIGTFDPVAYTWQAVQTGAWIDTNRFLAMTQNPADQAKLAQLNIPFVEVGRAALTGSGTIGGGPATVNMNDVFSLLIQAAQRRRSGQQEMCRERIHVLPAEAGIFL